MRQPRVNTLLVTLILLMSCSTPKPVRAPDTVLKVEIVKPIPGEVQRYCAYLDSPPKAPEQIRTLFDDNDVISRVYVHVRDYNIAVQWMQDMVIWGGQIKTCLQVLQGESD